MQKILGTRPSATSRLKTWWKLLKQTASEFSDDNASRIGAALAYYTVFSIAPIVVVAVSVAGFVFGEEAARGQLSAQLDSLLGAQAADMVETMVENTDKSGGGVFATVAGLVTLLLGASSVFVQLRGALNAMWDVKPQKTGIVAAILTQALSFAMVVSLGFLLMVSLVVSALLSGLSGWIETWLDIPGAALQVVNQGISLVVITVLFAMVYKFLPATKIAWGDVFVGALATAVLFTLGKFAIGQYLGHSSVASTYGAAGSLVVLLVWVYYSAQLILFGAEFTQVYARHSGSHKYMRPLLSLGKKGGEKH